jgi:hypothetical protein
MCVSDGPMKSGYAGGAAGKGEFGMNIGATVEEGL